METEREIAIKTENASVIYDQGKPNETKALTDVNVTIYKEDYIVIFGPSGCGKSTMLYTISGIEKPTKGRILVMGKDITQFTPDESAKFHRSQIGMVFQAYNLIPTLSVLDNVALPQIFRGVSREKRRARAKVLLQRFGILPQAEKLPTELSGGQQQRVGIARALINEQPIIFADEPVGNLDSKSAKIVLDILYDLNVKDKKTIILVTHDPSLLTFATHVVYMRDGTVVGEKRFTQEQREALVTSQTAQPFVSSPSGVGRSTPVLTTPSMSAPSATPPGELSAAEKSRLREEEAKKLVESLGATPSEPAIIQQTPITTPITPKQEEIKQATPKQEPKKELTIGELIKEKYTGKKS